MTPILLCAHTLRANIAKTTTRISPPCASRNSVPGQRYRARVKLGGGYTENTKEKDYDAYSIAAKSVDGSLSGFYIWTVRFGERRRARSQGACVHSPGEHQVDHQRLRQFHRSAVWRSVQTRPVH